MKDLAQVGNTISLGFLVDHSVRVLHADPLLLGDGDREAARELADLLDPERLGDVPAGPNGAGLWVASTVISVAERAPQANTESLKEILAKVTEVLRATADGANPDAVLRNFAMGFLEWLSVALLAESSAQMSSEPVLSFSV